MTFRVGHQIPKIKNPRNYTTIYKNDDVSVTRVEGRTPSGQPYSWIELEIDPQNLSQEDIENGHGRAVKVMSDDGFYKFVRDLNRAKKAYDIHGKIN